MFWLVLMIDSHSSDKRQSIQITWNLLNGTCYKQIHSRWKSQSEQTSLDSQNEWLQMTRMPSSYHCVIVIINKPIRWCTVVINLISRYVGTKQVKVIQYVCPYYTHLNNWCIKSCPPPPPPPPPMRPWYMIPRIRYKTRSERYAESGEHIDSEICNFQLAWYD